MITLAINWGYALLVTGVGMLTVFLLLVLLIVIINFQTKLTSQVGGHTKTVQEQEKAAVTTDTHPTPHEQAAIAMAMHLYFNAHDEEPHVITIEEVEKRYSPWSSKIYGMRNLNK